MLIQQLRNLCLFVCLGALISTYEDTVRLNKAAFRLGTTVAIIALLLFVRAWLNYEAILVNPSLWRPEPRVAYVLDQGGILRLVGLARDPNFYSLWLTPLFLPGFLLNHSLTKWLGMMAMGLSLLLAMSRTLILAFVLGTGITVVATRIQTPRSKAGRQYVRTIVVGFVLIAAAGVVIGLLTGYSPWALVQERFKLALVSPRWAAWDQLLDELPDKLLLGAGLRSAEVALGGMYSHNSYIDLLYETGVIGLGIWLLLCVLVTYKAVKLIRSPAYLPWAHSWFIVLIMMSALSLVYNPLYWMLAALLLAS